MSRQDMTQARAEKLALRTVAQDFNNDWADYTELDASPQAMRREQASFKARYELERFAEQRVNG